MNEKNRKITVGLIGVLFVLFALFWSLKKQSKEDYVSLDSGYEITMGTFARVVVLASDEDTSRKCIDAAMEAIKEIDLVMSDYDSNSELSNLNRSAYSQKVKVSDETFHVLQRSIYFSKMTDGAFDVTVGPLVDMWKKAADSNSVPSQLEIQNTKEKTGYEKLILDPNDNSVRFLVQGMRIDLGGIAKGYAVDKAIERIKEKGGVGAMVDMGSSIRCFGVAPKGKKAWTVALQNPDVNGPEQELLIFKLNTGSLSTSGNYERFNIVKGEKISHIINRKNIESKSEFSSVTVFADSAEDADTLSTAVTILGKEKGLKLIESIENCEVIFVSQRPGYSISKTSGAEKYLK